MKKEGSREEKKQKITRTLLSNESRISALNKKSYKMNQSKTIVGGNKVQAVQTLPHFKNATLKKTLSLLLYLQ